MDVFDEEVARVFVHLMTLEAGTEEYTKTLEELNVLVHISNSTESKWDKILKNPALIGTIGNLVLALLILNYERLDIITSRAFSFIRPK